MRGFSSISISSRSQSLLGMIKSRTGLSFEQAGRFAFCLSLNDASPPNPDEYDENGLEMHPAGLFGEYEDVFMALLLQWLDDGGLDHSEHLGRMARAHLNRGVVALYARANHLADLAKVVREEGARP